MDNTMPKERNVEGEKKPSQEQQQKDSSGVMKSRIDRQLKPPLDFSKLHDKRTCPYIKFEVLENAYKLAIDCKEQVILKFKDISMTDPQLEKCLQGGQDARDLIIILMELLDPKIGDIKRIFCSPLDKDDECLEEKILGALPFVKRNRIRATSSKLSDNTILQDEFVKRVKFGHVQYLLLHKKNNGKVPDTVVELLKKRKQDT
ncbi:hypothetical protein PR202_ga29126 [Eleusine coracana subsp. coracana]|uniref:Uncharacterized protein n=1 Tax=Eleusine coracana subsp. coracana TaxID=191504 RepID=A0AAV5DM64_ELECO|nr:hypothetical protein PR202_ga29126 [Eleusine coracana subsp. coracana]